MIDTVMTAHISGSIANVTVKQTFRNPNAKPLEAIYVFPLPERAAVHGIRFRVGGQTIRGSIKKRSVATAAYAAAKKSGKVAALLEQERPNVFTQAIANIFPKSTVEVVLQFDVLLGYADGAYSFTLPMVVGPRFVPGDPNGKPALGWGESPDTERVPDASRVTPPTAPPKKRSGRNVRVDLILEPGSAIHELASPTHEITATDVPGIGPYAMRIQLARADEIPNRDFVVRYRLGDTRPAIGSVSHHDRRGGFFALQFEPPKATGEASAKELVFVVDTSEAMEGKLLETSCAAIRKALEALGPDETFRIVRFADRASSLSDVPLANTKANRRRAAAYLHGLEARGGSEIGWGLAAALVPRRDHSRLRVVALLTTGLVANESEVLASVGSKLGPRTRVFALALGSAPNRYFFERLTELGRGAAHYLLPTPKLLAEVDRFFEGLRSPAMTDIEIDWKGLSVRELRPVRVRDLFVGQPLSVLGRYDKPGRRTVLVRGRIGTRRVVYEVPVVLKSRGESNPAIARLWARASLRDLETRALTGKNVDEPLAALGLEFGLVTRMTALVAVADKRRLAPGDLQTIAIPVDRPAEQLDFNLKLSEDRKREISDEENKEKSRDNRGSPGKKATAKVGAEHPPPPSVAPVSKPRVANQPLNVDIGPDSEEAEGDGDGDDDDDDYSDSPVYAQSDSTGRRYTVERGGWHRSIAIGIGATSGGVAGESAFATAGALTLEREVVSNLAIGAGFGLLVRGPQNDRLVGNALLSGSYFGLLSGALGLTLGAGPSVSSDSVGVGLMAGLRIKLPLPVSLQFRYDNTLRFGDDKSAGTATSGFEFSF